MKKVTVLILVGLLMATISGAALAGKRKAKPVATTLYLHGTYPADEAAAPDRWVNTNFHPMDPNEPSGTSKSQMVTNYVAGPNSQCSATGLFPVFQGEVSGTISGEVTFTIHTVAAPETQLAVDLFADPNNECNEAYMAPIATATVAVPPGESDLEVKMTAPKFTIGRFLAIQLRVPSLTTGQVRVYYDGADYPSNVKFNCVPLTGTSCTP